MAGVVPVTGPLTVAQLVVYGTSDENPRLKLQRAVLERRLQRAAEFGIVNRNSQGRNFSFASVKEPLSSYQFGTGDEILYAIAQGTGEGDRLGRDVFVKRILFNGGLTTASADTFGKHGAYVRMIVAWASGNYVLGEHTGGGTTWRSERLFRVAAPLNQLALVNGALVDDDPRFCALYDSGVLHIGGELNAATLPLSFPVDCSFRSRYVASPTGSPADLDQGMVYVFLIGCLAGEDASLNYGSATRTIQWQGAVDVEFVNLQ